MRTVLFEHRSYEVRQFWQMNGNDWKSLLAAAQQWRAGNAHAGVRSIIGLFVPALRTGLERDVFATGELFQAMIPHILEVMRETGETFKKLEEAFQRIAEKE